MKIAGFLCLVLFGYGIFFEALLYADALRVPMAANKSINGEKELVLGKGFSKELRETILYVKENSDKIGSDKNVISKAEFIIRAFRELNKLLISYALIDTYNTDWQDVTAAINSLAILLNNSQAGQNLKISEGIIRNLRPLEKLSENYAVQIDIAKANLPFMTNEVLTELQKKAYTYGMVLTRNKVDIVYDIDTMGSPDGKVSFAAREYVKRFLTVTGISTITIKKFDSVKATFVNALYNTRVHVPNRLAGQSI